MAGPDIVKFSKSTIIILLTALCLAVGVWIRLSVNRDQIFSDADEANYLFYVNYLRQHGIGGYKDLIMGYIQDQGEWRYPSPIRYGYLLGAYFFCVITDNFSLQGLANFSTCNSVLALMACYFVALRAGGSLIGLVSVALYAVSPLSLAMGRRALADMSFIPFIALGSWFFYEAVFAKGKTFSTFLAIALLALAAGCREQGILILGILTLFLFSARLPSSQIKKGCFIVAASFLLFVGLYYVVSRDLLSLYTLYRSVSQGMQASNNPYVLKYQSGPFYRYAVDFLLVSPFTTLLLPIALFQSISLANIPKSWRFFAFLYATFFVFMSAGVFSFNLRFVLFLEIPAAILTSFFLVQCAEGASIIFFNRPFHWKASLLALFLLANCCVEWSILQRVFLVGRVYDPVTSILVDTLQLAPQ